MISLFAKHRAAPLNLLKLPVYAVPNNESSDLDAKREAQLQWMREKGMGYLGDPLKRSELREKRRSTTPKVRLVSVRRDGEPTETIAEALSGT